MSNFDHRWGTVGRLLVRVSCNGCDMHELISRPSLRQLLSISLKVMWNSAHVMDMVNEAKNFGVIASAGKFDWPTLKEARDSYITRLNGIYERNLGNSGVEIIQGVSNSCYR